MRGNRPAKGAVVITGASTGIGRACALLLDRQGYQVFAGVRTEAAGAALCAAASGRLVPVHLDVTDAQSIAAAAAMVRRAVGDAGVAGLVNNAGVVLACPLEFVPLDELRRQLEVNVVGQIAVTQAFLGLLRHGRGRIVNMGSIDGRMAVPLLGPYCASKFALEALTDALRLELRPWGIAVSIVEPSAIATPIWEKSLAAADALAGRLPAEVQLLYGAAAAAAMRASRRAAQGAASPDTVAHAVAAALTAARPRTRYLVGRYAQVQALLARLLPDHLRDRLILRAMGMGDPVNEPVVQPTSSEPA